VRIDRRFRIQITSAPDDEELVAEVWRGEEMLAELRHEAIGVAARLFPPRDGAAWDFTMDEILGVLAHEREVLGPSQISRSPSDHRDE
jgi:hypothetical protein